MKVLDHGYVELIETWGSDERIIEAARMSTNKGFLGWGPLREHSSDCMQNNYLAKTECTGSACKDKPGDEKLLAYLWKNRHATPFEMGGATFEIMAPIFVFREWHRHRTQSYNEMSARYTPLPDLNYVPEMERLLQDGGSNKQARSTDAKLSEGDAEVFRRVLRNEYTAAQSIYENALAAGVPKELARLVLPMGRYSRMRASANLRNWLGFLTLRMASNAQWEIRQYANAVHEILAPCFPRTLALFDEGRTIG